MSEKRTGRLTKITDDIYHYRLSKLFGTSLAGTDTANEITRDMLQAAQKLPENGSLILDFKGVVILDLLLLHTVLMDLTRKAEEKRNGLFRWRYIVVKDPNESVHFTLQSYLKKQRASALVMHTDNKRIVYTSINLPDYLITAWKLIKQQGSMTTAQLTQHLASEGGTKPRERLRQLHKRGFVRRREVGRLGEEGHYFVYEPYTLPACVIEQLTKLAGG